MTYLYDDADRLIEVLQKNVGGSNTARSVFTYDGMSRKRTRSQILSYSSDGQLMQINANAGGGAAGAAVAGYGYRSDGLRAWKQDAAGNRTFFYYEGGQLLAVQNQSDASTRATVMLWGADGLIGYRWTDASGVNRSRYHLYDAQGNLAQALDEAGNVVETTGVTAHGMPPHKVQKSRRASTRAAAFCVSETAR